MKILRYVMINMFRRLKEFIQFLFRTPEDGIYRSYDGHVYVYMDGECVYDSRYESDYK